MLSSLPGLSFSEFLSHVTRLNVVMKGSLSLFSLSMKHDFHQSTFLYLPCDRHAFFGNDAYSKAISAAAAKSLQSCPTLCDPIDVSPPGSPAPGILQARTLEWVDLLLLFILASYRL